MSEQKTLIRITKGGHSGGLYVRVNGNEVTLPTDGTPVEVTDDILGVLENSNAEFERVGAALSDAPASEGDGSGEQPSPSQPPDDEIESEDDAPEPEPEGSDGLQPLTTDELAVLDQSVPKVVEAVKDWPAGKLGLLVAAENAGNTRKSLIAAIEALPQTRAPAA